ncbi:MAG: ATP-binding protein [Roseburia hominis]
MRDPASAKTPCSTARKPFYRESADRNDKSHFGLGLSIADQLARGLGGSITLCNAPAGGAVVIVRLPLTGQLQRDTE